MITQVSRRLVLALALALAAAGVVPSLSAAAPAGLKVGDPFPDLSAAKLEGQLPADLKGKVVLVDFWASWCGPCKKSFPVMEELQKKYGPRGFAIVAVSVDEKKEAMADFLKKNPVGFAVVRDAGQKLVAAANATAMPTSFLLDGTGKIRYVHEGFRGTETRKEYEHEIESLLGR